jgi:hypothetical protein
MLPGCRLSQARLLVNQDRGRGIPAPRDGGRQGAQGGPVRARECTPGRSCGPLDLWSGAARFECWWPLARGNPASYGSSRDPAFGRARWKETEPVPRVPRTKVHACGDGRRKFLPVMHRAGFSYRDTCWGSRLRNVHAGSSGGRWQPFRDERSEGSRTQRWGTAADEE